MTHRPNRIHLHVSDAEKVRIERLAAAHGVTVSAFVREVLARYRSTHEPPGAPLLPTLEPDDARARVAVVPVFDPPENRPEKPDTVIGIVLTDREAVWLRGVSEARGLKPVTAIRKAVEAADDSLRGSRRNFGERRDRPISIRLTARSAEEIRGLAKSQGRPVGDVVLERFAAWART